MAILAISSKTNGSVVAPTAAAPVVALPYSVNYASSYTANTVNHAFAAPVAPLVTAVPASGAYFHSASRLVAIPAAPLRQAPTRPTAAPPANPAQSELDESREELKAAPGVNNKPQSRFTAAPGQAEAASVVAAVRAGSAGAVVPVSAFQSPLPVPAGYAVAPSLPLSAGYAVAAPGAAAAAYALPASVPVGASYVTSVTYPAFRYAAPLQVW